MGHTAPEMRPSRVDGRVVVAPVFRRTGEASDLVAVEEPLELRIGGDVLGVLMRTPGEDHRLALGFLFSERIIESAADVTAVFHCGRPGSEGYGNTVEVTAAMLPSASMIEKWVVCMPGSLASARGSMDDGVALSGRMLWRRPSA